MGIQIGPREQKVHANPYFNELRCGDLKQLAYVAKTRAAEFPEVGTDCEALGAQGNPAFCYRMSIAKCLWVVYDCHFGFCGALRPEVAAKKGLDMALKYFQVVRELLPTAADARDWMQGAAWVEPYSEALLLAILAGGTVERTMLSDYLLEDAIVDKLPLRPSAAALGVPLLCIAASFQSSQVDTNALIKRIQKSRQRRPSLLCEAWQALQNKNHSKFTAALADSTMIFARTTASDDRPFTAIALPESILAGLAYESGWTDLSFDLPVAARLVTRRSLAMN